jgi:hypothetical protein
MAPNRKCPSGKVGYASHRRAMMAVGKIVFYSRREEVPQRAYRCQRCRRWHLTSQPRRRELAAAGQESGIFA